jgi:signal peptidase
MLIGINVSYVQGRTFLGYTAAVVMSGSMEPTLSVDDLVIIRKTDTISPGDIILYQIEGDLVIHRIVEIDGDTITTKGDANNTMDTPFDKSCIKGILVAHSHLAGKIFTLMRKYYALLLILFVGYIVIGFFERTD